MSLLIDSVTLFLFIQQGAVQYLPPPVWAPLAFHPATQMLIRPTNQFSNDNKVWSPLNWAASVFCQQLPASIQLPNRPSPQLNFGQTVHLHSSDTFTFLRSNQLQTPHLQIQPTNLPQPGVQPANPPQPVSCTASQSISATCTTWPIHLSQLYSKPIYLSNLYNMANPSQPVVQQANLSPPVVQPANPPQPVVQLTNPPQPVNRSHQGVQVTNSPCLVQLLPHQSTNLQPSLSPASDVKWKKATKRERSADKARLAICAELEVTLDDEQSDELTNIMNRIKEANEDKSFNEADEHSVGELICAATDNLLKRSSLRISKSTVSVLLSWHNRLLLVL